MPGARAGISHFVDQQPDPGGGGVAEARILNVRPPYANFTARHWVPSIGRAKRSTMAAALRSSTRLSSAPSSATCARTGVGLARPRRRLRLPVCAAMPPTSSTAPWKAMPVLAFLHAPHRADQEVVRDRVMANEK